MNYTDSSWFHLSNFTKIGCDFQWMFGVNQWNGLKDFVTGVPIKKFESVFWNRKLNANVSLNEYNKFKDSNDENVIKKMKLLGLPKDIKVC